MKQIASCLAVALVLAACTFEQSSNQSTGFGRVRMSVSWPQRGFGIAAIPSGTEQILIQISGQGLSGVRAEKLERAGAEQQSLELALPTGPKQIEVLALDGRNQTLARASESVRINQNATTRLEMNLAPTAPSPTPAPSASPTPGAQGGSGNGGSPGAGPGGTAGPLAGDGPPPASASSPPAAASPLPTSHPGGGGSSSNARPLSLSANPNPVTGLYYPTEISVSLTRPNPDPQDFIWSCVDASNIEGCGTFQETPDPLHMVWKAPGTAGVYRIRLTIDDGENAPISDEVEVSVLGGVGAMSPMPGGFDGGTN